MYSERDAMGLPFFRQRLLTDMDMTADDMDRWDSMGRVRTKEQGFVGGALGAVAGAAAGYASRRDPTPPPEKHAYVDADDPQTLFIPEDPPPPEAPRRLTRSERDNERRRQIRGPQPDPFARDFARARQALRA